jgi:hypothetical protein
MSVCVRGLRVPVCVWGGLWGMCAHPCASVVCLRRGGEEGRAGRMYRGVSCVRVGVYMGERGEGGGFLKLCFVRAYVSAYCTKGTETYHAHALTTHPHTHASTYRSVLLPVGPGIQHYALVRRHLGIHPTAHKLTARVRREMVRDSLVFGTGVSIRLCTGEHQPAHQTTRAHRTSRRAEG